MTSQVEVPPLTGLIHFNSGKRRVKFQFTADKKRSKTTINGSQYMLTLSMLLANSADDKLMIFSPENRIRHFMQTVSKEKICMKCQILFAGKNKKNISK